MKNGDRPLVRHLTIAVIVKLLALTLLWWFFIRDAGVHPDTVDVAVHVSGVASQPGVALPSSQLQGVRP
ncbi:MAG TPA: hypothetical protein VL550_08825 [Rhodocyclaceae bacterium]|nr:hypothetical protein [Rhodocyclaceae bacterium]